MTMINRSEIFNEVDSEIASNSYLMSLIGVFVGLPLPIVNLIGNLIYYIANRKSSYVARWHCTQALVSQLIIVLTNSIGFWWTISIIFSTNTITNHYITYLITVLILNIADFIATFRAAIKTRKGIHVEWYFFGPLTNLICKQ